MSSCDDELQRFAKDFQTLLSLFAVSCIAATIGAGITTKSFPISSSASIVSILCGLVIASIYVFHRSSTEPCLGSKDILSPCEEIPAYLDMFGSTVDLLITVLGLGAALWMYTSGESVMTSTGVYMAAVLIGLVVSVIAKSWSENALKTTECGFMFDRKPNDCPPLQRVALTGGIVQTIVAAVALATALTVHNSTKSLWVSVPTFIGIESLGVLIQGLLMKQSASQHACVKAHFDKDKINVTEYPTIS